MKRVSIILATAAALSLSACAGAPAPSATSAGAEDGDVAGTPGTAMPTATPTPTAVVVDLSKAKTGKTATGVEVTFSGTRVADASEVASEPTPGMVPLVIQFEYRNQGAQSVKLQPVPLTVYYGPDKYEAKQPTLYQGGMTRTELPKQIAPGSTVPVADTFLVPADAILSVEVDPGGSSTPNALPIIFAGVPAK